MNDFPLLILTIAFVSAVAAGLSMVMPLLMYWLGQRRRRQQHYENRTRRYE